MEIKNKIIFVDILRGIAVISVVFSHYFRAFFINYKSLLPILNTENYVLTIPPYISVINHVNNYFSFGSFGVAVFFLISGFIIPFTLEKHSIKTFLFQRIFRIFPVYVFSFALVLMVIYLASSEKSLNYSYSHILSHFLLLRGWLWLPSIDEISWTLEIEVFFYLLAIFFIKNRTVKGLIVFFVLQLTINLFINSNINFVQNVNIKYFLLALNFYLPFITYMMMGTLIYFHYVGRIHAGDLVLFLFFALICFFIGISSSDSLKNASYLSYLCALVLFFALYIFRETINSFKLLAFISDISYPLYCMHGILGYFMINYLIKLGFFSIFSIFLTLFTFIIISYHISKYIEKPLIRYSKKI